MNAAGQVFTEPSNCHNENYIESTASRLFRPTQRDLGLFLLLIWHLATAVNFARRLIELRATGLRRRRVSGRAVVRVAFLELTQSLTACFARREMLFIVRHAFSLPT